MQSMICFHRQAHGYGVFTMGFKMDIFYALKFNTTIKFINGSSVVKGGYSTTSQFFSMVAKSTVTLSFCSCDLTNKYIYEEIKLMK
jgi:hypothetical protein